jgi:hypothetical protein
MLIAPESPFCVPVRPVPDAPILIRFEIHRRVSSAGRLMMNDSVANGYLVVSDHPIEFQRPKL